MYETLRYVGDVLLQGLLTIQNPSKEVFYTLQNHLDSANDAVHFLKSWECPVPTYELIVQSVLRLKSKIVQAFWR